mgnify:CR=1 FL=1
MRTSVYLCLVLLLALPASYLQQTIKTNTYNLPRYDWTTGNKNKFLLSEADETLYGLLPAESMYPTVIDPATTDFVRTVDYYIDNVLIFDFANIDPKDFKPEEDEFPLAFQRRLDPFIYAIKFILAITFVMYFIRLQYGSMGGFKKKVMRLRERNKATVHVCRSLTLAFVLLFGTLWLVATIYSQVLDNTHIIQYAEEQTKEIKEKVTKVKENMFNLNGNHHIAYFTEEDLNWPYFNIADSVERSYLEENINRDQSHSITKQIAGFLRWYLVIGLVWWVVSLI